MKVLIFSASTGGGHKRAAAALKDYFKTNSPKTEVEIMDGIALTGDIYNHFICEGYTFIAKNAPNLYGHIYKRSDKDSTLNSLCNNINKVMDRRLLPAIEEYNPDVIITCHAFVSTMIGDLKTKGKIKVPVIALITDFAPHYTYISEGIDHYIVNNQKMVNDFKIKYDIDSSRVHLLGIPVFQKFLNAPDKIQLKEKLNLKKDAKTVLFMAGSFGVTEVLKVYEDIADKCPDAQLVVITGNNEDLYNKFLSIINTNTKLLMFIDNVEDYMHCSDIIITKPGGLTVSESLQCELPMAIYSAFPGQEADNADFLVDNGVAIMLKKHPGEAIKQLINNDEKLLKMSDNCRKINLGNPCENIFNFINSIME